MSSGVANCTTSPFWGERKRSTLRDEPALHGLSQPLESRWGQQLYDPRIPQQLRLSGTATNQLQIAAGSLWSSRFCVAVVKCELIPIASMAKQLTTSFEADDIKCRDRLRLLASREKGPGLPPQTVTDLDKGMG